MYDWQLKYVTAVLFMYIYNYLHSTHTQLNYKVPDFNYRAKPKQEQRSKNYMT